MTLCETSGAVGPAPAADLGAALQASNTVLTPTIFHEPWWLEASSAGCYGRAEVFSGGTAVGSLPYIASRQFGQSFVGMPMLTHFLGPAIDEGSGSPMTRRRRRIATTRQLIRQLPASSNVWFKLHRGVTETLAFGDAGFKTEVQFTSVIAPAAPDRLWASLHDTIRRVIRRADEKLTVIECIDPSLYMDFYDANLHERGLRNHYDRSICLSLMAAAISRGAGRLLGVVDDKQKLEAAIFTVWDSNAEYYLMSTRRQRSDNGAVASLIWTSMKHAAERGITFDLDGIRKPADARFLTKFGGTIEPRFVVSKSALSLRLVRLLAGPH